MSIVVEELGFSYCTRRVLSGVSFAAVEKPGILTALIGAPFFIYLICRREKTL